MKKLVENHTFKTVSIIVLFILVFLLIIAIIVKIDGYKRSFYKLNTKFNTDSTVKLGNKLPISDEIGKNYSGKGIEKEIVEYKEFSISNPNEKKINYEIYLTKNISNLKFMRSNYVRLYLTDKNNNLIEVIEKKKVVSYYDLYSLNDKPGSVLLYRDSLESGESKSFILRSWVADTYILSSDEEWFSYNISARIK